MKKTAHFINCKGQLLDLSSPVIMGILNVTPDSFYDGGKHQDKHLRQVEKMLKEGAGIIDVGGMSSRPGADFVAVEEELNRVLPVIENVIKEFPQTIISIDTIRAKVAKESIGAGASMVNDISAGAFDADLLSTVAKLGVPYVLMHLRGKPKNMQDNPQYVDIVQEVMNFFIQKIAICRKLGIKDIVVDVGFGFGKTIAHNYQLLKNMGIYKKLEVPILAGISRKSMIYKVLETTPSEALNGTTALNMIALQQGAKILRVHDVKEATEVIKLWELLENP